MIDILECTLCKAVDLAIHFMDENTQIEVFKDGHLTGIKTLQDLKSHSNIYECMSDGYGFIDRVVAYDNTLAIHVRSY